MRGGSHYSGTYPSQEAIWNYMGGSGSSPSKIAEAVNICVLNVYATLDVFGLSDDEQNHSISDQLYSISSGYPCIPIVDHGWHAVVLKKAKWHRASSGTPYMDDAWYHDPDFYNPRPNEWASIASWKSYYNSCRSSMSPDPCYITVIELSCVGNPGAMDGYNQFRMQGGTYYAENPADRHGWVPYMI
jgi:hypothetical protein